MRPPTDSEATDSGPVRLCALEGLDPDAPGAEAFGGKALGLARLRRDGVSTPAGFAVSASTVDPASWPADVRDDFARRAEALLAAGPVAVRSSARGEDGEERSFAGLFESELDRGTLDEVWAAAARCVASGGAERVLQYAGTAEPIPVGLVVQQMVAARAAGVVFTRDPRGVDPALVLEAVAGTGDALVSGRRAPERWRVYRSGRGGWELHATPSDESGEGLLDEETVRALADAAWTLAERWCRDLDLEWALDDAGAIRWLQARPITTGARWQPPPVVTSAPSPDDGPVTVWANWNVRETMPDPLAPLSWGVCRETMVPFITRELMGISPRSRVFRHAASLDLVGGRVYFNMNGFLSGPGLSRLVTRLLRHIDERAGATTQALLRDGVLTRRRLPGGMSWRLWAQLSGLPRTILRAVRMMRPRKAMRALEAGGDQLAALPPVVDGDDAALVRELRSLDRFEMGAIRDGLAMANAGFFVWLAADHAFRPWPAARRLLAAGVEGNPTTAISIGIDELVAAARPLAARFARDPDADELLATLAAAAPTDPAAAAWLARLKDFLARFGHRAPGEFDVAAPRWGEAPEMVVELVRAGLAAPETRETVAERLARLREDREAAVRVAVAAASWWKRPWLRWLARKLPVYMPLREAPKHHALRAMLRTREAALELGRRLVARGTLAASDDVWFLELEELEAWFARGEVVPAAAEVRGHVSERREALARCQGWVAPDFVRSDGVPVREASRSIDEADDGRLHGEGIGGGRGAGPVTVLDEPDPRRVRDGDVLVMRFADPGWTPLFPRAAAVVMEVGGSMCHAAVVARELGIPSVFGVRDATRRLANGSRVTVDGDAGWVRIEDEQESSG